jgi:aminoglycoside phosphotransferase (APT) family kinase protein
MHDASMMPDLLSTFLSAQDGQRRASVVEYEPMVGGYSRIMAKALVEWSDGRTQHLVLRGDPPPGKSMMETDRDLEWALLNTLTSADAIRMPAALHYDGTGEHLGTKCIVIEHVDGPSLQAVLDRDPEGVDHLRHQRDLFDTMAAVHAIEPDVVAGALEVPTEWDTYLGGLIDRFRQAEAAHVESNPFLRYVAAWLDAHRPEPLPLRLVHSDFQPANLMVDSEGRHLVIDWELAHVGDPREDLGYYNVYSSASGPNLFMADPEGFLARYRERTGFGEEAVNMETMAYFSSLAAVTVYSQVLGGAGAMARGLNAGLMTTYTVNALTVGHTNFMAGCVLPESPTSDTTSMEVT